MALLSLSAVVVTTCTPAMRATPVALATEFTLLVSIASTSMPAAPVVSIFAPVASPALPMRTLTEPLSSARVSRLPTETIPAPPAVIAPPLAVWVAEALSLTLWPFVVPPPPIAAVVAEETTVLMVAVWNSAAPAPPPVLDEGFAVVVPLASKVTAPFVAVTLERSPMVASVSWPELALIVVSVPAMRPAPLPALTVEAARVSDLASSVIEVAETTASLPIAARVEDGARVNPVMLGSSLMPSPVTSPSPTTAVDFSTLTDTRPAPDPPDSEASASGRPVSVRAVATRLPVRVTSAPSPTSAAVSRLPIAIGSSEAIPAIPPPAPPSMYALACADNSSARRSTLVAPSVVSLPM